MGGDEVSGDVVVGGFGVSEPAYDCCCCSNCSLGLLLVFFSVSFWVCFWSSFLFPKLFWWRHIPKNILWVELYVGFSCNFLDPAVRQSPQGLSWDIFDKCSQPEYAGNEMIRMPQVYSNISITAKLGVINSQFYRFLRLCSCKKFFVFQMVSLIVLLKIKR
jgi:hypothetical protein